MNTTTILTSYMWCLWHQSDLDIDLIIVFFSLQAIIKNILHFKYKIVWTLHAFRCTKAPARLDYKGLLDTTLPCISARDCLHALNGDLMVVHLATNRQLCQLRIRQGSPSDVWILNPTINSSLFLDELLTSMNTMYVK